MRLLGYEMIVGRCHSRTTDSITNQRSSTIEKYTSHKYGDCLSASVLIQVQNIIQSLGNKMTHYCSNILGRGFQESPVIFAVSCEGMRLICPRVVYRLQIKC